MNRNISDGIINLASQFRINAISCMSESPLWEAYQPDLDALPKSIEVGLHLNLTHSFTKDTRDRKLSRWIRQSLLRKVDGERVYKSFQKQWDLFVSARGMQPDFIDGHQHIHVFPQIRNQLKRLLLEKEVDPQSLYIRDVRIQLKSNSSWLKSMLIKSLASDFRQEMLPYRTNDYFAGIYNFDPSTDYRFLMDHWCNTAPENTIIMCHPSVRMFDAEDEILAARINEYHSLLSRDPI
jgi:predicted glycoside hydrolase/deacetylase ChbG (UPF0249 family)